MIEAAKILKFSKNVILIFFLQAIVFVSFSMPFVIYAQNESKEQPKKEKQEETTNDFTRANKSFSKKVDKVAEDLDKNISPLAPGEVEDNKTKIYFLLGGDVADNGDVEGNFRYGAQLHLPRFERYWKVKFDNQDEKRERGQSALVRSQRARRSNDEVFLGVSFTKRWDRIKVDYKPQLAISKGVGIDHSIEADTEYEYRGFNFEPKLEFFANHDQATGTSGALRLIYWLYKKKFGVEQGNDARFLFIDSYLSTNHYGGFVVIPSDRWHTGLHYFRSFENKDEGYRLSAYGYYLTANYMIYRDMLAIETKPYIVFERAENFHEVHGIVVNFRVIF